MDRAGMSEESGDPKERRRAARFSPPSAQVKATVTPFTPKGAKVKANQTGSFIGLLGKRSNASGDLLDIGQQGLRLVSNNKLASDMRLRVTVMFGQRQGELDCVGTVRWIHPHTKPDEFVVGVEFDRLSEDQVSLLTGIRKVTP